MMDETQERQIADGMRAGSADAWRALYDAYAERVWRWVARLLGSAANDIADVVQETFLSAARSAHSYDAARGELWQWLWGIARRQVALYFRKQERIARLRAASAWLAAGNGQLLRCLAGEQESPPERLESAELRLLIRATLSELPQDYENLLTAKYLEGMQVDEIAQLERSTSVAVRSKLARARQAFRHAFAKHAEMYTVQAVRDRDDSSRQ